MAIYAVTAIGEDRPGIVAAISEVLAGAGGNLEDSEMSILRGHFAVMLIVAIPDEVGAGELRAGLDQVRQNLGLEAITLAEVNQLAPRPSEATHVLSVYGADHPGIVQAISSTLAERAVNITDLETRLVGEAAERVYVMLMEIAVPGDVAGLQAALDRVGERSEVEVSLRELEAEPL